MTRDNVAVFFYGLFMDESLLESKGIVPSDATSAYLDGYRLRIGNRATLVPEEGSRAYGILMTVGRDEASQLYSDDSVADYVPEAVSVTIQDGVVQSAICYNLPASALAGANAAYAGSLLQLATRLGFPGEYLEQIRAEGSRG